MKTKTAFRLLFIAAGAAALYYLYCQKSCSDLRERLGAELGPQTSGGEDDHTGIPNPVKKLSPEEFNAVSGAELDFAALSSSHPRAYSIGTAKAIYGVELEDSDCLRYDFRFSNKDFDGDISGMYYEWTQVDRYPQDAPVCEIFLNETGQGVCRWEDDTRKYTVSMTEGASLVKLVWMRQRLSGLITGLS